MWHTVLKIRTIQIHTIVKHGKTFPQKAVGSCQRPRHTYNLKLTDKLNLTFLAVKQRNLSDSFSRQSTISKKKKKKFQTFYSYFLQEKIKKIYRHGK